LAQINGCGKWRIPLVFIFAFILWSSSYAEGEDDAAARAERLRAKGDYTAAVEVLADAIKADPLDQRLADMLRDSQRLLSEENTRLKKLKASSEAEALRVEARTFYEKGDLDAAIRAWSQILVLDPQDDSSAWMIQKAQTRKQLDPAAFGPSTAPRDYSKKIKTIADDIAKLIAQAKEKLRLEVEERKRQELAILEEDAANEKRLRLEEERQSQEREEAFIAGTFKQGQEFYAKGKYDEALRAWETVLPLLAQDSELKAKITVLCAQIKKESAPSLYKPIEPVETPKPVAEPAPVIATVEEAAPVVVPVPAAIIAPVEKAPEIIVPVPEPVKAAAPVVEPAPAPITAPVEIAASVVEPVPEPITAPAADKNIIPPAPAVFLRIIITSAIITILLAAIWAVFYILIRFTRPRRKTQVGKGFDPSKLASFLKKAREDEHRDKDIFRVR